MKQPMNVKNLQKPIDIDKAVAQIHKNSGAGATDEKKKTVTVRSTVDFPELTHKALLRYLIDHPEHKKIGPFIIDRIEGELRDRGYLIS